MMTNQPKLPRLGSAARTVLMNWEMRGGLASWSHLEEVYMGALRRLGHRPMRCHITMNLARLLKRYGTKLGPCNSRAQWQLKVTGTVHPPVNSGAQVQGEVEAFVESYFGSAIA